MPKAVHLAYSVAHVAQAAPADARAGRPALYPDQLGLVLLTLAALGGGIYLVVASRELATRSRAVSDVVCVIAGSV